MVATHPVQFLSEDDYKAHEARVCIAEGYVLNDKRRVRAFTAQQYFKTQAEMAALFADLPEAMANSVEIAKRCNLTLKLGKPYLPDFPTPNGVSLDDFLRTESELGLQQRMAVLYPDERSVRPRCRKNIQARLEFEIQTIIKMGFPGYFLIVADFIRWAKSQRRAGGPGARFRCGLAGGVQSGHYRSRSAALRTAVRALPQSRARIDARLRRGLLPGRARARHRICEAEIRRGRACRRSSPSAPWRPRR